jgi:prepilin-type N-terminal cleavage/methylation domain-containing protein
MHSTGKSAEEADMRKSGFTLIELLIVLAILGILVGIVAMNVGNLITTALKRGLQSEYGVVQTAMDAYTTQDVTAGTSLAITESSTYGQIASGGTSFGQYLERTTKYFYVWGDNGEDLVVRDKEADADWSLSWNGTAFVTPTPTP